jgi:phosphate transport system substrate-binding protein
VKSILRLTVVVLGAAPVLLAAADIRCASADSMDGLMSAWTAGYTALHPDTPARIAQRAAYSADFVEPLAQGRVEVAAFSREWFPAERAHFAVITAGAPLLVPVATGSRATKGGTHAIVIFVNDLNPITHLSLRQLREILADDGQITTWGQLGLTGEWASRKISLNGMQARRATGNPPGIVNFLEARLLAGRAWRQDIHEFVDTPGGPQALEQIVRAVAADEAALGYSGFAYSLPGTKTLELGEDDSGPFFAGSADEIARGEYPLARTVYLALGPKPDEATLGFVRYVLSPAGQQVVAADREGFLPLTRAAAASAAIASEPDWPAYVPQPVAIDRSARYLTTDGAVAIIGYNDMLGMMQALDARFTAAHPEIRFALTLKGTRTAPPALARGESLFAPMGAEFSPEQLSDYLSVAGREPIEFRIAHDSLGDKALSGPLAILVHRDNPMTSLTLAQLADIFAGRESHGLHPGGLRSELALGISFRTLSGLGEGLGPGFRGFAQSSEVVQWVATDPMAIGFAAVNRVTPDVKVLALARDDHSAPVTLTEENVRAGRYPLDRFLLIYARRPLEPLVREYLRFVLSREGQEIIAADSLGYLPLNATEAGVERARLR